MEASLTNLSSLLFEHPSGDTEPLVHTIAETRTAGEVRTDARRVAEVLEIAPGDAVAIGLPNGPDLLGAMFGVWLAGGVLVPMNPRQTPVELSAFIEAVKPAAIVTASGIERRQSTTHADDVALITFTSGTTGQPKPIMHTHAGYLELLDRVLAPLKGDTSERAPQTRKPSANLIPVSMALNAGIYNTLFGLRAGAPLVIMEQFDPTVCAELVRRFQIRSTVLPPAAIAALTDSEVSDLTPLKYVRSITASLSPLQARRFQQKFSTFVLNSYGQAEIGEVIGWTSADARDFPAKIGAVGRPHAGVDIRFDTDGCLLVRPPTIALGLDGRTDDDGYVNTGDIAILDEDGFVWIEGRQTDLINRGGNKIFPDAVEEVLLLHPNVFDVAVVATPDERLGEVPVAVIVGDKVDDEMLVAHCREYLTPYKVPVSFAWVESLPRNAAGKLLRKEIAASLTSDA